MKNIMKWVVAIAFTAFSAGASAVPIGTLGSYDTLLNSATLTNSGAATEEQWIEDFLTFDIDYTQLDSAGGDTGLWEEVIGGITGDYAFNFTSAFDPDYFLVKVGNGNGNDTEFSHYLFSNLDNKEWAFLNLSVFGPDVSLVNIGIISHIGITGGTSVPEPSVVGLLAISLLGVVAVRRRMKS